MLVELVCAIISKQDHHYEGVFFFCLLCPVELRTHSHKYPEHPFYTFAGTKWFLKFQGTIVWPYPTHEWFNHSRTWTFHTESGSLSEKLQKDSWSLPQTLLCQHYFSVLFHNLEKTINSTKSSQRIEGQLQYHFICFFRMTLNITRVHILVIQWEWLQELPYMLLPLRDGHTEVERGRLTTEWVVSRKL